MKKLFLCVFIFLLFSLGWAQDTLKYLSFEIPPESGKSKNRLAIPVGELEALIQGENLGDALYSLELSNTDGKPLSLLATIQKGKIKWASKLADKVKLLAEFQPEDYSMLVDKIQKKAVKPGLLVVFRDQAQGIELKRYELTFLQAPELSITFEEYPIEAKPGEAIANKVKVKVENTGVATAHDVVVEAVMSTDDRIPVKKAPVSEAFVEDGLLKEGRLTIPVIEPGKPVTLAFGGGIKIADDAVPQRYFMGVVVDPENKIAEINEENNFARGGMMVAIPIPKRIVIDLPETVLTYEVKPQDSLFKLECNGLMLSDGKDWRICRLRPYQYQFSPRNDKWKGFFWEVVTYKRAIYEARGGEFCKRSGSTRDMRLSVDVKGGSTTAPPRSFAIRFPKTQMIFDTETRQFTILINGLEVSYPGLWSIVPVTPYRFQLKFRFAQDDFLEVDVYKKEVLRIKGTSFPAREVKGVSSIYTTNLKLEF